MVRAGLVVLTAAAQGCVPPTPTLYDPDALLAAKRVSVLPLADGPGPSGKSSARVVAGVVLGQIVNLGRYSVVTVSEDQLQAALKSTNLAAEDCYDPAVAAALGRELGADMVVTGGLPHFGTQQEMSSTAVLVVAGGGTNTTHWVCLNLRLVRCSDGKVVYTGFGTASSPQGYAPAAADACRQATLALKFLLDQDKKK